MSHDTLLCTIDVVGLYPNIPHKEGLEALKIALEKRDDKTVSTESLLELAKCVLENNVFEHNGSIFKQKQGTAIGTKMAPPYAILFMSYLEELLLDSFPLKPKVWWRYIDDIFLLWEHGEDTLKQFIDHLNKAHPTIKFTAEYSKNKINFLDVEVSRKNDKLITDLYVKPTDTHQYLDPSSCHPAHCINSIPYSQALRLNRICSETSFFDKRCNELEDWLIKRGYDEKSVRNKILDARKFNREDLLNKERNENVYKLTLNITFHPAFRNLSRVLSKFHTILACNKAHQDVFQHIPIVGFRKGKSLKDMLVRAKVPLVGDSQGKSEGCAGNKCKMCPWVKNTTGFTSKDGVSYSIRSGNTLRCNSANVVYLLTCKTCGIQYVGSCTTPFRSRFANYKSFFSKHFTQTVPQQSLHEHFDLPGHNGFADFEFTLIDQGVGERDVRIRGQFWYYKLKTAVPNGLNEGNVNIPLV